MNLIDAWSPVAVVVAFSLAWSVICIAVGWIGNRIPRARFVDDGPVTRLRGWERDGRTYERVLGIKRWKDLLPEAGSFFRGGVSKRSLRGHSEPALLAFAAETRRAERVHWTIALCALSFFVWCPFLVATIMVALGLFSNLPFVAVQRYNRARVLRIVRRLRARAPRASATGSGTTFDDGAV